MPILVLGIDGVSCESVEKLHNAHSIHFIVFTVEIVLAYRYTLRMASTAGKIGVHLKYIFYTHFALTLARKHC
jgi:hypothetical protein